MTEKKIPWIVAAILASLLVIVTFLWIDAVTKLDSGNLSQQKDLIREYCSRTDDESRVRCGQELADLETMLQDFAKDLRENPQATVDIVSTSTATSTGQ